LRRTLAFQIVEAALAPDPAPRAPVRARAGVGYALAGHGLIRWWGGDRGPLAARPVARPEPARRVRSLAFVLALAGSGLVLWLPALGVFGAALTPSLSDSVGGMRLTLAAFARLAQDAEARALAVHSLTLGGAVLAFDLLLARGLAARLSRGRGRFLAHWPESVPPLGLAVGALMLPSLLRLGTGRVLETAADAFDPYFTPGTLLFVAVAALRLPRLARRAASERAALRSAPIDAALALGAAPALARRIASHRRWGAGFGAAALTVLLAATNLAPALVLAPTGASRTVAPAVLLLADRPGDGLHRAAALGACLIVLNVAALGLAEVQATRVDGRLDVPVY
jgi:iron(III) transport system permease protein